MGFVSKREDDDDRYYEGVASLRVPSKANTIQSICVGREIRTHRTQQATRPVEGKGEFQQLSTPS